MQKIDLPRFRGVHNWHKAWTVGVVTALDKNNCGKTAQLSKIP